MPTRKIQVVDVKAGGYVSKEKLDAKITELDGVKQQLSDANTTIQSYKDMDIDGIKQSAKDWETKYTQENTEADRTACGPGAYPCTGYVHGWL